MSNLSHGGTAIVGGSTHTHLDPLQLSRLATSLAPAYKAGRPFPHIVIDDLLPIDLAAALVSEFPAPDSHPWHAYRNAREQKLMATQDAFMPPTVRHTLRELNAAPFVEFLEVLTGIEGLIPDPHLVGGGMHQIQRGGFLKVHADFNRHPRLGLERRLNVLLYLNPDWRDEYGGHLELWDRDMQRCESRVAPTFNRCVIFNTTSHSFHGHPTPLACPEETTRRSLALYYYSAPTASIDSATEHSTLFRRVPGERRSLDRQWFEVHARSFARQALPPFALSAIRSARRRRLSTGDQ
jgi:Rps23 Pro-64 3,4-dihydroxylase Tpa1-like proline 4-hydroxylase